MDTRELLTIGLIAAGVAGCGAPPCTHLEVTKRVALGGTGSAIAVVEAGAPYAALVLTETGIEAIGSAGDHTAVASGVFSAIRGFPSHGATVLAFGPADTFGSADAHWFPASGPSPERVYLPDGWATDETAETMLSVWYPDRAMADTPNTILTWRKPGEPVASRTVRLGDVGHVFGISEATSGSPTVVRWKSTTPSVGKVELFSIAVDATEVFLSEAPSTLVATTEKPIAMELGSTDDRTLHVFVAHSDGIEIYELSRGTSRKVSDLSMPTRLSAIQTRCTRDGCWTGWVEEKGVGLVHVPVGARSDQVAVLRVEGARGLRLTGVSNGVATAVIGHTGADAEVISVTCD